MAGDPKSPSPAGPMLTARRMQRSGVAWGAALTAIAGLIALYFDGRVAAGVFLGGGAGTLGFWLLARRMERLSALPPGRIAKEVFKGVMVRLGLYAVAMAIAYGVDPESFRGLLGGAGGLLIMHVVVVGMGVRSARQLLDSHRTGEGPPR